VDLSKHRALGGSWYFLTFTNAYTRKTWIYFLAIKFAAFQNSLELHKEIKTIERANEKLITVLKDD
jgi:hypothetical protein